MMSIPTPSTVGEGEEMPRRRGRLRKKGKRSSRALSACIENEVKGFPEPGETQVIYLADYSNHTVTHCI